MSLNKEVKLCDNVYEGKFDDLDKKPTRHGFGEGLVELGKENKDVVVLCGDLTDSTQVSQFKAAFPERFIEVGIAEQNMLTMAVGLSMAGKIPFLSTYGVFCPGRCWDQIRISAAYGQANIKFSGAHTGISVGPDGATHQALEDIAITRVIPNVTVLVPADFEETKKATVASAKINGPVYQRFGREKVPIITTPETPFEIGKAHTYREGTDVAIIACGVLVHESLKAATQLEKEGISVKVINMSTVKPMDEQAVLGAAKECGAIVTAEEHQAAAGMGSAVAEIIVKNNPVPMKFVGVKDRFGESGQPDELMAAFGLIDKNVYDAVKEVLKMKK